MNYCFIFCMLYIRLINQLKCIFFIFTYRLRNKLTHLTEQYALSEQAFGEKVCSVTTIYYIICISLSRSALQVSLLLTSPQKKTSIAQLKQKMLELQLADLKIQQHQERTAQEQTQKELYVEQVSQLLETEKSLRLQLAADGEKFQQFQVSVIHTLPILCISSLD